MTALPRFGSGSGSSLITRCSTPPNPSMTIARIKILVYKVSASPSVPRVLVIATQFSSTKLLRLLSRDYLAQATSEIELLHVEDEPRIMRAGETSGKKPPEIPALGFRSHRCGDSPITVLTPLKPSDEAVVRFSYPTSDRGRTTPFGG